MRKINCLSYFGINVSKNLIVSSNFFRPKSPLKFWKVAVILSVIPTVSCSVEWSLSVLQRPETNQKYHGIGLPQSSNTVMYWTCLCQQSRYWKSNWWVFNRKSLFQVLFPTDFNTKQGECFILNLVKKVN